MRWTFGRTAMWFLLTIAMAAVALAAVQDLPEGPGKAILEANCTICHDLDRVKSKHYDKDSWQGLIESMRDKRGGPKDLTDEEIQILADYLSKNFGPASSDKPAESK
jgi:cytochrome c5